MATSLCHSYSAVRLREGGFPGIHYPILYRFQIFYSIALSFSLKLDYDIHSCSLRLQETTFIEQLVEDETQMEGTPQNCSRIMNWHLHLESRGLVYPKGWLLQNNLDAILPMK